MNKKLLLPLLGLTASLFSACAPTAQSTVTPRGAAAAPAYTLQLLHFADVDGGRDIIGNAPRFSALVNHFRNMDAEHTLLLSSGDNWIPGPEYNVAWAAPSVWTNLNRGSAQEEYIVLGTAS